MFNCLKLALLTVSIFAATSIVGITHAGTMTPTTSKDILDTQAAIQKRGPRVSIETYKKVVPVYLSKSGELTSEGTEILGVTQKAHTSSPQTSSSTSKGTQYQELIGAWKTGPSSSANRYDFHPEGRVVRSYQTFSGGDRKYTGTKTEDFQAVQETGKIVVTPKGKSDPQEWFEIALPFDPAAPAATFVRIRNGERTETPFSLVRAAASEPNSGPVAEGTVQRTVAHRVVIIGSEKRRFFNAGSPVEVSLDRTGLPAWAEAIVFKGRSGQPDEKWLIPAEWLTEGEPFEKKSNSAEAVFPPSKRLESLYLEIAAACFVPGSNGRNLVLMPGARVRAQRREQTSDEYGRVPGFQIQDGLEGITVVLPESYFANNGVGYQALPTMVLAKLAGNGTEESPFLIRTKEDFLAWCHDPSKWDAGVHSRLESDIDLSGTEYDEPLVAPLDRESGLPPESFRGVLDGNRKKIAGLRISTDRPSANAALFQEIGLGGIVRNLTVDSAVIEATGLNSGAAILCFSNRGVIENCRATGIVTTDSGLGSAGLCVENRESGKIIGCSVGADGKTTLTGWQAGGLCSLNEGMIERSAAAAEIRGHQSGGLVSSNQRGTIRNCLAAGLIVESANVGGLVGKNSGAIENCVSRTKFVSGKANKTDTSGGLVARNSGEAAEVVSSFWDIEVARTTQSGGGTGIPSAQMKDQHTFQGWDFDSIWCMGESSPELRNVVQNSSE